VPWQAHLQTILTPEVSRCFPQRYLPNTPLSASPWQSFHAIQRTKRYGDAWRKDGCDALHWPDKTHRHKVAARQNCIGSPHSRHKRRQRSPARPYQALQQVLTRPSHMAKITKEQSLLQRAAVMAIGRALRHQFECKQSDKLPDHILEILDQLESDENPKDQSPSCRCGTTSDA
jgi:hypothetical protein